MAELFSYSEFYTGFSERFLCPCLTMYYKVEEDLSKTKLMLFWHFKLAYYGLYMYVIFNVKYVIKTSCIFNLLFKWFIIE